MPPPLTSGPLVTLVVLSYNQEKYVRKAADAALAQTYSPLIASVEVKRKGDVRRAKLYYLRDRSGKSARIREKLTKRVVVVPETSVKEAVAE